MQTQYLSTTRNYKLAYHKTQGVFPGVMFLGGFKSDMNGSKALALEAFCKEQGRAFIRFDYFGHGQSDGDFREGSIGRWAEDARDVFDQLAEEKYILVGSSMGGWLMFLLAQQRQANVAAMLGIASAPDFTTQLILPSFNVKQRLQMVLTGHTSIPNCYGGDPYPISHKFLDEAKKHHILQGSISIPCPVALVHGTHDEDVPVALSLALLKRLTTEKATLTVVKNADHRMSSPECLHIIITKLKELLNS